MMEELVPKPRRRGAGGQGTSKSACGAQLAPLLLQDRDPSCASGMIIQQSGSKASLDSWHSAKSLPSLPQGQHLEHNTTGLSSHPSDLISHLSAKRQMLEANPELKERRKALSKAAFVRHDNSEMMDNIRRAAAALKMMDKNKLGAKSNTNSLIPSELSALLQPSIPHHGMKMHIPGVVYGEGAGSPAAGRLPALAETTLYPPEGNPAPETVTYSFHSMQPEAQVQMARAELSSLSVPATPIALRSYTDDFSPDIPGTMNGIGHPLLDSPLLLEGAINPKFVFRHKHAGGEHHSKAAAGTTFTLGNIQLPGTYQSPGIAASSPTASKGAQADDHAWLAGSKSKPSASSLLPIPSSSHVIEPQVKVNKPLSDDTLNLWRGKRLNLTEMKIEAQLHRLRNNPAAKGELQVRVSRFLSEKAEEAAEMAALQLFASETREQKALTFLQRQMQYAPHTPDNKTHAPVPQLMNSKKPAVLTGVAALFDSRTGEPVEDGHPLPASSLPTWHGLVALSKVLHALHRCVAASHWAHEELGVQTRAATRIQAAWKGHQARKLVKKMKARRDYLAQTSRKMRLGHTEQSAAQLILQFLQDYDLAGRKGAAAALMKQAVAGVGHDKARAAMVRNMRLAILIRQWSAVEAAAIEIAKKRLRGNAALGVTTAPAKKQTVSGATAASGRRKGSTALAYNEDREAMLKAAVEDALAHTFINDKIILEDLTPVPEVVKATILNTYLEHKMAAYMALVGVIWKERAEWRADRRHDHAKVAAQGVMVDASEAGASPEQPEPEQPLPGPSISTSPSACLDQAFTDHDSTADAASTIGREASFQMDQPNLTADDRKSGPHDVGHHTRGRFAAPSRRHQNRRVSTSFRDCPHLPHFRALATPMEMKALMQQGVHEMPSFISFKIREAMGTSYVKKVTDQLLGQNAPPQPKGAKPAKDAKRPSKPASGGSEASSFTVALLLHRWRSECNPRSNACLRKRYGLLKVDLVDCLSTSKVWNSEEVGQHLQNLVAAT